MIDLGIGNLRIKKAGKSGIYALFKGEELESPLTNLEEHLAAMIEELEQRIAAAESELEQLTICGWLFQDEYTRLTEIVDNWQIEKGFEWQNPRWKKNPPGLS